MLQLKYNGEVLDISNDQDSEMEKTSPLFLIDDFLAEYSTPIQIKYSGKNARILGFLFFDATIKIKSSFEVEIFTNNTFRARGTLVIDNSAMNRDFQSKSSISGYLLTGITSFFTLIKDKKLSQLTLGGIRNFNYTTSDPTDGSGGYWQHFQDTYGFTEDYVMAPFINEAFTDENPEWELASNEANKYTGSAINTNHPVFPFTKVEYVLRQIFEEHNWQLDTTALDGSGWDRLILYTIKQISTNRYSLPAEDLVRTPITSIEINLAEHMPPDVLCSNFIFELCKRYFWFPLCDTATRICKIIPLKDLRNATVKDWTKYAAAVSTSDFTVADRIFGFRNNFVGDDSYPSEPNLKAFLAYGTYYSKESVPSTILQDRDVLIYGWLQNRFYTNAFGSTEKVLVSYGDNIYNDEPDDATDIYETDVTTLPIEQKMIENGFYAVMPIVNQEKNTAFGIRTLLFHGMVKQLNGDGLPISLTYPYASSIKVAPAATASLPWSNVWSHKDDLQVEHGIKKYWADIWLQMISPAEVITRNIYLPLHELAAFAWDNIILIHNIPYFIRSYVEPLNYKGMIQAKLQRIKLFSAEVAEEANNEVYFGNENVLSGTPTSYTSVQQILGPPGATVTVKVSSYTRSDTDYHFYAALAERFLDDEITIILNGDGVGTLPIQITGVNSGAMAVQLEIIASDTGTLGSPLTHLYSKAIL